MIEIHNQAPQGFSTELQVSACYLLFGGKILLLKRAADKIEPHVWGVPAGKLEPGETPLEAAIRELHEETAIRIIPTQVHYLDTFYIKKPNSEFIYHRFKVDLTHFPDVQLSREHTAFTWASQEELSVLPLVIGARELMLN
jgi:8-oxo-dGTP pyrophosphatase MutT (NUDIX family)